MTDDLFLPDSEYLRIKSYIKLKTDLLEKETHLCSTKYLFKTLYSDIDKLVNVNDLKKKLNKYSSHSKYKLVNTVHSMLIIVVLYNDYVRGNELVDDLYFTALIYYNALLNKYLRYCDDNLFQLALNSVKSTNIFRSKGVLNGLKHISISVDKLYDNKNFKNNINEIELMLYSLRTRIAQSLKSIIKKYYYLKEKSKTEISDKDSYKRNLDRFRYKVEMLGHIDIPVKCLKYKSKLEELKEVDIDLLEQVLTEIYTKLNITLFNQQKVVGNLDKLESLDKLVKLINSNDDIKYCLVKTLLITAET
ncbi:MAG: hypothetical protein ACPLX8_00940 [Nanopusillaceae archaeon]